MRVSEGSGTFEFRSPHGIIAWESVTMLLCWWARAAPQDLGFVERHSGSDQLRFPRSYGS
jgi:hypothetical protein